jgi:DNA-binding NarL/FixJ family response regulator
MSSSLLAPATSQDAPGAPEARRVLLLDPREERRAITSHLVERSPLLTVVGLAATVDEADALIRSEHADVAIIEIQMPVPEGLAAIGVLRDRFPDLQIVVSSFHFDPATRAAVAALHVAGYLMKPLLIDDLLALIDAPLATAELPTQG